LEHWRRIFSVRATSNFIHATMATTHHDRLTLGSPLDRVDTGTFTVTRSAYSAGQVLPAHTHESACATVVLRGVVKERVEGRRFECTQDRFLVRPAGVVHENAYGARGAECVIIGARRDWVASDRVARAVFDSPRTGSAAATLIVARRISRELRIGDHAATLAVEGLVLELIACASRQLDDVAGRPRRVPPPWLRAVRARLHEELAQDVRLHAIAEDAGVHAVYLARAFRECFGCTPGEYVRQRRIDRACQRLAESTRSVAEVAVDAGFASPSHFATAFRRATGMTPRQYRMSAQKFSP
jgi:AraC-like DNA-binding protein/quercetin dioxygenase-like cupin family protein